MKVVILAGGFGTRISEESGVRPKPMVEIGGKPILWHILKIYSHYGLNDFVICLGYKGGAIKDYFASYLLHSSNVTFDLGRNRIDVHQNDAEPWRVTLIDTGESSMTGGRLKRVQKFLDNETFCMTYGDGVSNVDISKLIQFHRSQGVCATLTAALPPGRFGAFALSGGSSKIATFHEKPEGDGAWVNSGFFVLEPKVFDYIAGDSIVFEREPLEQLANEGQLVAYKHHGFWQPMDSLRDKNVLESLWQSGNPPWRVW
jgi:glucose-1-phosphate cytidylyltransferase